MKMLHILREAPDDFARETIERQSADMAVTVVLIQEAVAFGEDLGARVLALAEDVHKREKNIDVPLISYRDLLALIFSHDQVYCW